MTPGQLSCSCVEADFCGTTASSVAVKSSSVSAVADFNRWWSWKVVLFSNRIWISLTVLNKWGKHIEQVTDISAGTESQILDEFPEETWWKHWSPPREQSRNSSAPTISTSSHNSTQSCWLEISSKKLSILNGGTQSDRKTYVTFGETRDWLVPSGQVMTLWGDF